MALTPEQIDDFKASFTTQLKDFMQRRADDIGDPGQWRLSGMRTNGEVGFVRGDTHRSFTFRNLPADLDREAMQTLRTHAYNIAVAHGFRDRRHPPAKDAFKKVREGDPRAWQDFVARISPKLKRTADRELARHGSSMDPDDVIGEALAKFYRRRNDPAITSPNHADLMLFRIIKDLAHTEEPHVSVDADQHAAPENPLKDQLDEILEEAKKSMTPRQRDILDTIIELSEEATTTGAGSIARRKQLTISATTIGRELAEIRTIIRDTAREMPDSYADARNLIEYLIAQQSKRRSPE